MGALDKFISALAAAGEEGVRRQRKAIIGAYGVELVATLRRVSEIKNLLYRLRPAQIKDIFVEPEISDGINSFPASVLFERFCQRERVVVRGSAGLGKSVLLKRFCLKHVDDDLSFAPLFLELRKIEESDAADLCAALFTTYRGKDKSASIEDFKDTLNASGFSVILDGFDEINATLRDKVEGAILRFANDFPACPVMVSGRSERSFLAWEQFRVYDIKPMTEDHAIKLISLLDVDEDLKARFITEAIPKLFSHKDVSFVQTPLLAVLMLLTYGTYADVPKQMHLFYANAFETLLRDHDLTKSQFRRDLVSGLPEEEFKKLFSVFCAGSYSKGKFEFARDEIEQFLVKAVSATSLKTRISDVISDLTQSVCVMQYESLEYSFVHRSFQEYFTAVYLRSSPFNVVKSFLDSGRHPSRETVLPMLLGMDRDRIEKEWALEALKKFSSYFHGDTEGDRVEKVMQNYWSKIKFGVHGKALTSMSAPKGVAFQRHQLLELMYPDGSYPMWWFRNFSETSAALVSLADHENVVELERMEVPTDSDKAIFEIRRELEIDLSNFTYRDAKEMGLYDDFVNILSLLDGTLKDVSDRVMSLDDFATDLF